MGQQVRVRRQQPHVYGANTKTVQPLSRGMIYRELALQLTGQTTDATNAQSGVQRGDEWGVVQRIDIVANGNDVIRSLSGNELWWYNKMAYGASPRVTSAIGAGTANPSFDSTLIIPFWMPQSVRPLDTALDSRRLSDLRLEITWGTHANISSTATAFTTTPQIQVMSVESWGVDGPFSGSQLNKIQRNVASANQQERMDLPTGPMYRGFLINVANTANTADQVGSVTNVKLISGTNVIRDMPFNALRDWARLRVNSNREYVGLTTGYIEPRRGSTNNLQDSWVFMDLVTDGLMTEAVDAAGLSELYLEFNVGAACTLNVLPMKVIPIRRKQAIRAAK